LRKTHFSCVSDGCLAGTPVEARRQVVVVGTEAHVCVLQTVLELRWQGKEVFVVADAVGSRQAGRPGGGARRACVATGSRS
jgi:nicotinamidase-related amidase